MEIKPYKERPVSRQTLELVRELRDSGEEHVHTWIDGLKGAGKSAVYRYFMQLGINANEVSGPGGLTYWICRDGTVITH